MERTKRELKDELLRVYRTLLSTNFEVDRLKGSNSILRRKVEIANEEKQGAVAVSEDAERRLERMRHSYDELMDENGDLVTRIVQAHTALDAALDLVGAVIESETEKEALIRSFTNSWMTGETKPIPGFVPGESVGCISGHGLVQKTPHPTMPLRNDGAPLYCLSCNGIKEEDFMYFCEACFELDIKHDFGLFSEAMTDWYNGKSDFPRAGKNVKELAGNT